MMTWGVLTPDSFLHELSKFLANNPYEEEGQADAQLPVSM